MLFGSIHPVSMDLDNLHNLYLRQHPGVQRYVSQLFVLFGSIHPVSMDFDPVIYITCIYDSVQVYSGIYHSYLC